MGTRPDGGQARAEIGIDDFHANRSPDKPYRTTPLNHYQPVLKFEISADEKRDLVEFLKSL